MRDRFKEWCETSDISVEEINDRALKEWEAGKFPTMVYVSEDLYRELQMSMMSITKVPGPNSQRLQSIMSINTAVGSLNIQPVKRLRNFLLIGRKEDLDAFTAFGVDPAFWNDQERARIDKAFEDLIILEDK